MGMTGHGALHFYAQDHCRRRNPTLQPWSKQPRLTYVDDIVEGVIRVTDRIATENPEWDPAHPDPATSNAPYRVYNIGSNNPTPLLRFIDVLENTLGIEAKRTLLPMQPGDVEHTYADVDDLIRDVGYQPTTKIEDGVAAFARWYKDYYNHADIAHNLN